MNWFTKLFTRNNSPSDESRQTQRPPTPISLDPVDANHLPPRAVYEQNLLPEQLKKFIPLRDLDEANLNVLPHATLNYSKDAIIFDRGQNSTHCVYYLLEGHLLMQPESESHYEVIANSPRASLPLNSGTRYGATATALTDVSIIRVSVELNRLWAKQSDDSITCVELVDINLPKEIANQHFFTSFSQAYRENKLRLPSLPNVAIKLKQALQKEIGISEAVDIIHIDPPIVTKLIQVANSPLYGSLLPINNCHDAVNRIGLNATRNLVMGIGLKELFRCKNRELMTCMQGIWKNSLYVSSLSFVLAQEFSHINPDDALLAGLVADIGAIPLLHFAEQFPEQYPSISELDSSLPYLRGPVGSLVLHTLGFPENLTQIPHHAENWLYDTGSHELTLVDIVILAKLHSYFGSKKAKNLPYINSIPAYSKISNGRLEPDFSLTILHKAQKRINAAMHLLS